jgi:aminomuconate-semialdehyde/2-hydroxymuconate-6-semialdehyde dehydrogenase
VTRPGNFPFVIPSAVEEPLPLSRFCRDVTTALDMRKIRNFIDGQFVEPLGGKYLDNIEPATGKPYSQVPDSDGRDVEMGVAAAEKAFDSWSKTPAADRSRLLLRIADFIERDSEKLARAESIDTGKPLSLARSLDIPRAASNFRFFATAILHTENEAHITDGVAFNYTLRQARGIAGLISPWNLPLYLLSWKIAPAIAVGNTAIAKPSELTPMTASLLCEICAEAGLPNGVLNIVQGTGPNVGAAITAHPKVGTISFTGGTVTGRKVAETCAPLFKKVSLELGGKNPNIVFADADLDAAITGSVRSSFANQGQVCLCGSRVFVERSAYKDFVDRFIDKASQLKQGDPLEEKTEQGAIVSQAQLDKVKFYVDLAQKEGGKVALGGKAPDSINQRCRDGYFFPPTILTDLPVSCRTNREEIFGPVVTITPFDSEEEVIGYANDCDYGLASSVWTQNLNRAHRVAEKIHTGTVWVNCWLVRDLRVPFGGMKQSGVGREGGEEALRFFTEPKNVCIAK